MHWRTIKTTLIALGWFTSVLYAQDISNLAVTGDVAPDGNGSLGSISIFALKEGAAAYSGLTTGNSGGSARDFILATVSRKGAQIAFREGITTNYDGTFAYSLGHISVNNRGRVAFIGGLQNTSGGTSNDEGIFSALGSSISEIARENHFEPMGGPGVFNSFGTPTINNSGQVAFWGAIRNTGTPLISTHGIFIGNGTDLKQVARTYTASPDGNGEFSSLSSSAVISDSGEVSFRADLRNTSGGENNNSGIFKGNGTTLTVIARENDLSPDGNGRLYDINSPFINDSNRVVFYTTLRNTSGGNNDNVAIFAGSGGGLTKIARTGDAAPNANGYYTTLGNTLSNNRTGEVVFIATLSTGKQAVIWSNGVTSKIVALSGDSGPDTAYTLVGFTLAAINNTRTVTFQAELRYGIDPNAVTQSGIFMSDGEDTVLVAKTADQLGGSTISSLGFDPKTFNNFAELAFQAILKNGKWGVYLYSPKLKWRHNENGDWDNASRWTASLSAAGYVRVDIDPVTGAVINGPVLDTEIRSLNLGTTSIGITELNLQPSGRLTVAEGTAIGSRGKLTGNGRIIGDVTNQGEVSPGNSPGSIVVEGNYTQLSSGSLRLELGGTTAANHDQLIATGNVQLAGTLQVVPINGFVPAPGNSFTLVTSGGTITGAVTNLVLPQVSGINWQLTQTTTSITLTAVSSALLDFRTTFGLSSSGSDDKADWSNNGVPNLLYFLMNLGDPHQSNVPTLQLNGTHQATSGGLPVLKLEGNSGWSFSFVQRQNATGYDYVVEVSKDLSTWSDVYDEDTGYSPTELRISPINEDYDVRTLFFNQRTDPTFLRVRIVDRPVQ